MSICVTPTLPKKILPLNQKRVKWLPFPPSHATPLLLEASRCVALSISYGKMLYLFLRRVEI